MLSKKKKILTQQFLYGILTTILFLIAPILPVKAQSLLDKIKYNLGLFQGEARLPQGQVGDLPELIGIIVKIALLFVGIIFLVIIIYSGFIWMTAGGNPERVKKAASMIRNSVIGLLIIFVSYALTIFVFDVLLKASV